MDLELGRLSAARASLVRGIETLEASPGANRLSLGLAYANLGLTYRDPDTAGAGLSSLQRGLETVRANLASDNLFSLDVEGNLADHWIRMGAPERALAVLARVERALRKANDHEWLLAFTHERRGRALLLSGRAREAVKSFQRAAELWAPGRPGELGHAYQGEGRALLQTGDVKAAVRALERAVEAHARSQACRENAQHLAMSRFHLARALWSSDPNERPRALQLAKQALQQVKSSETVTGEERREVEGWVAQRG
jgi:eukaryotic-like serine/threonine-protein kinase